MDLRECIHLRKKEKKMQKTFSHELRNEKDGKHRQEERSKTQALNLRRIA